MLLWAISNYDMFHRRPFLLYSRGVEMRTITGYLPIPRMVHKNGAFCGIMLTRKIEVLEKNLSQCLLYNYVRKIYSDISYIL